MKLMYAGYAWEWDEVLMTGDPKKREFTAFYAKDNRLLAAAGTQDDQIAAFMERMRTGDLPAAEALRGQSSSIRSAGRSALPSCWHPSSRSAAC